MEDQPLRDAGHGFDEIPFFDNRPPEMGRLTTAEIKAREARHRAAAAAEPDPVEQDYLNRNAENFALLGRIRQKLAQTAPSHQQKSPAAKAKPSSSSPAPKN